MEKEQIIKALQKATSEKDIQMEFPEREEFGDYTTNIAMLLAKKEGKNPQEVAAEIVKKLGKAGLPAEALAKAGFINFWLKKEVLLDTLVDINTRKDVFGKSDLEKGKKIMVEFAHPNTHKPFHIGHLRNITTGEAICRLLGVVGADVIRVNYQGDVGLHIAKAMWGIKNLGFTDSKDVKKRAEFLGRAYVEGNKAYEENEKVKEEIHEINEKLYSKKDSNLNKLYEETRRWSLEYFNTIYHRVYTKFDRFYFESEVAGPGKQIAMDALKKGIFVKSKGAVIFPGKKYGLHDRVFITGLDVPTYEAKDLGLATLQFKEFSPDIILHVVGPEQGAYFQVIFKALELLEPETKGKEVHLAYGWVRLKKGKMASRTGNVVLGEWLLDEVKKRIIEKYDSKEKVAEEIAVGAVKYSFLKPSLTQEIAFDIDESISLEGNSGPYLQYTVARTNSVLAKTTFKGVSFKGKYSNLNQEELSILRSLSRFSEVIESAAKAYSPNLLCNYLFDLAQKFNTFYNAHRIIGSDNLELRLRLTAAVGIVLKSGLGLLGIEAPQKM